MEKKVNAMAVEVLYSAGGYPDICGKNTRRGGWF